MLIVIAAGGWYLFIANRPAAVATGPPAPVASNLAAPAEAKHLSIVVLPFTNLSGDPAQDYFADGITENLTTDLSRIRNSFVIARNTAFTYKGKNLDAKEIGKELGVRYVLEGSVQRDQNRVRVNAQLIDAESGAHLWADRFEEDVADLFKLQDQVVLRLANTLGIELVKAEAEKGARSKNPDADRSHHARLGPGEAVDRRKKLTKEKNEAARALFEQALKIDPNNADALAGEAYTYTNEYSFGEKPRDRLRCENPRSGRPGDRNRARHPLGLLREMRLPVLFPPRGQGDRRRRRRARDRPEFRPVAGGARQRQSFCRPFRTSQVRYSARDAAEPARTLDSGSSIWAMPSSASGISTPQSTTTTGRSTSACTTCGLTQVWRPRLRSQARWTKPRPLWPKPAAWSPNSQSNS